MAKKTIELPCDVGDTVYMITNYVSGRKLLDRAIIEGQVDRFIIGDAGIPMADICTCNVVEPVATWCPSGSYSKKHGEKHRGMFTTDRARNRAKTFVGIAEAMAEQWGKENEEE